MYSEYQNKNHKEPNNEIIHEYMWIIILVQSNNEVIHEYMWIIILVQSNNEVIHEYMWIIILVQSNNEVIHEYMWIIILVQSNNEVIHEYMWIIILVQSEWFIFVIRNKNSYTIYYIGLMFLFVLIRCLIKTGFSCLIKWNSSENDVLIDRFSTHNEFAFHH